MWSRESALHHTLRAVSPDLFGSQNDSNRSGSALDSVGVDGTKPADICVTILGS